MNASPSNQLPGLPRLVFRIGFAGNKALSGNTTPLGNKLHEVFTVITRRICEIAPEPPHITSSQPDPVIRNYYSKENALVRLVTGLCEGADELAADRFLDLKNHPVCDKHVETRLAAVVPFELDVYQRSRPATYHATFAQLASQCEYIVVLDGRYEKPDPDTEFAKNCRNRAYRGQSKILLRNADILVAVADVKQDARPGGTIETIREALTINMPVVFINADTCDVRIVEPAEDPALALSELSIPTVNWEKDLRRWITDIVTTKDVELSDSDKDESSRSGMELLNIYFNRNDLPPHQQHVATMAETRQGAFASLRKSFAGMLGSFCPDRDKVWDKRMKQFQPSLKFDEDPETAALSRWRKRATKLNYHYSNLYRGTFLLNYRLAWFAVALAALGMFSMGAGQHGPIGDLLEKWIHGGDSEAGAAQSSKLVLSFVLVVGLVKLMILGLIFVFTKEANNDRWNEKAVDFRYIAERLRAMYYLPRLGSFRAPSATLSEMTSRAVRQSAIDWLFGAIERSVSPAELDTATDEELAFGGIQCKIRVIRVDAVSALSYVKDRWVKAQAIYHDKTSIGMSRLYEYLENWSRALNILVVLIVILDGLIVIYKISKPPGPGGEMLFVATLILMGCTAIIPAIVSSLNGVAAQTECRRLAERSAVMRTILRGRDPREKRSHDWRQRLKNSWRAMFSDYAAENDELKARVVTPSSEVGRWAEAQRMHQKIIEAHGNPTLDPKAWAPQALHTTERVAQVFVQEVSEWSVLYAKEVPEV